MPTYTKKSKIYLNQEQLLYTVGMLYHSAIYYYKRIEKIKLFDEFSIRTNLKFDDPRNLDKIDCFLIEEHLLDCIKLSMAFENFMKADLLNKGYLAHNILNNNGVKENSELYELKKKQYKKRRPILISDFLAHNSFFKNKVDRFDLINLDTRTVSFKILISNHYQSVIKLPKNILTLITKSYDQRNTLHFNPSNMMIKSLSTIKDWKQTTDFVNINIIEPYNQLIRKNVINGKPSERIKLKKW